MTRSRISLTACVGAAALLVAVWTGGAAARPHHTDHAQAVVKLGMITKFPVGFYTTLQNGAKKFDKADARREGDLRPGKECDGRRR